MLDDYNCHYDKYDKIEEYDDKDRSQESAKKCSCVGEEAAGGRKGNKVIHLLSYILLVTVSALICILLRMNVVYCAFSNIQSSIIVFSCGPLYHKIITEV